MHIVRMYNNIGNFSDYIHPPSAKTSTSLVNVSTLADNRKLGRTDTWATSAFTPRKNLGSGTILQVLPTSTFLPLEVTLYSYVIRDSTIFQGESVVISNRFVRAPAFKNHCNRFRICASLCRPRSGLARSQCVVTKMRCFAALRLRKIRIGGGFVQRLSWMFWRYKMPATFFFLLCCILG